MKSVPPDTIQLVNIVMSPPPPPPPHCRNSKAFGDTKHNSSIMGTVYLVDTVPPEFWNR